ncbi:2-hydroxychromene-2-carboxylate isomerase [uncultured Piscinibacter sp.]|uniref:2-hydroxychromene-2-carboxylate isomerase n=1 Tax=uncultured Piscinibacter sp. TaxID=1131835 RepID=UPI002609E9C6|nr:2-hydroxychromene-2-carboxylate isomerase [uncultured Piscinibacter sp.]
MKQLQFWFDPVSPYAHLAFEQLPQALEGLSYSVDYRPILFAGLLKQWGQKGPAEIEPKRAWTFRQVAWQAHRLGIEIATPAQHPFNPLALLRLLHACAPAGGSPNRWQCEQVFHHVWHGGGDANDARRLADLRTTLAPATDPDADAIKQSLKDLTAQAIARGVFGVPTVEVDGRLFWGLDGLDMLAACLRGDAWFDAPDWSAAAQTRPGVTRG